jgi:hypothetical protein
MTVLPQIGRLLIVPAAFAVFIVAVQSAGGLTMRPELQAGAAARAACASDLNAPALTGMCPAPQG